MLVVRNGTNSSYSFSIEFFIIFQQTIETELLKEFDCIVPYIKADETDKLCKFDDYEKIKKLMKKFRYLASNGQRMNCSIPCSTLNVNFGVLFNDGIRKDGKSQIRIYLKSFVKIQQSVQDYTLLTLLAELGGYTGLLLGVSLANLTVFVDAVKPLLHKQIKAF